MPKQRHGPSLALALLAATMLTPPTAARAEPGQPLGDEFPVNSYTTGNQVLPAVDSDTDGDFVIVWFSDLQDGSVFAQRFNGAGQAAGPEIPVNSITTGVQSFPAVALDEDGDFVVVWNGSTREGVGPFVYDVFARRYDAAGNALDDAEFQVNTVGTGIEVSPALPPAVASDADGDFVVVWQIREEIGDGQDVYARLYDAAGVPRGPEFRVNTTTAGTQGYPAVAMDTDGDFVVAWHGSNDFYGYDVFAQRFDAAGEVQGPELVVNTVRSNAQWQPAVAMDDDGDFVVTWQGSGVGDSYGIFARRYNAAGEAQGSDFLANTEISGDQFEASVTLDADGDLVVAWSSRANDSYGDVVAQRFDAAGGPQGGEILINATITDRQLWPSIAADADGDFVVAWHNFDPAGSGYDVLARRFQGDGPVPNDFTVDGRSDILWRHSGTGNAILWQMDGFAKEDVGSIGSPDTDWQVKGLADFDADTRADILWRSSATGLAVIWRMAGFVKEASAPIGNPGPDWRIAGTGDFDGDDHADILWRNTASGAAAIWLMEGFAKKAVGEIGRPDSVWQVAGVGDFDADAKADILWRDTTDGTTVVWKMDGLAKAASATVGKPPLDWQVKGLADFNADAKADILWRHASTGTTVEWQMDGLSKAASATIGKPPLVWALEGAGDTDGGRQADILWRNTDTDKAAIWQMDGFTKVGSQVIGTVPAVWQVQ